MEDGAERVLVTFSSPFSTFFQQPVPVSRLLSLVSLSCDRYMISLHGQTFSFLAKSYNIPPLLDFSGLDCACASALHKGKSLRSGPPRENENHDGVPSLPVIAWFTSHMATQSMHLFCCCMLLKSSNNCHLLSCALQLRGKSIHTIEIDFDYVAREHEIVCNQSSTCTPNVYPRRALHA